MIRTACENEKWGGGWRKHAKDWKQNHFNHEYLKHVASLKSQRFNILPGV